MHRHGYFGDVPYIPPLEASMFYDDLCSCHTHRLPRDKMYDSGNLEFYVADAAAAASAATQEERLSSLLPIRLDHSITSSNTTLFPIMSTDSSASPQQPDALLYGRYIGLFTVGHRIPRHIEAMVMDTLCRDNQSLLPSSHAHGNFRVEIATSPRTAQDWVSLIDCLIEFCLSAPTTHQERTTSLFVVCNVDALLEDATQAAMLSVFLLHMSAILRHYNPSRCRVLFSALDDESGMMTLDALQLHCERVGKIATVRFAAGGNVKPTSSPSCSVRDLASSSSTRVIVKDVIECCAQTIIETHDELCNAMETTEVGESPVVFVWTHESALQSCLQKEVANIYVAEPVRLVCPDELRTVTLPFEVSPVMVMCVTEDDLRTAYSIVENRGLRLHSVICLSISSSSSGSGGVATSDVDVDVQTRHPQFLSREAIRSSLLWLEEDQSGDAWSVVIFDHPLAHRVYLRPSLLWSHQSSSTSLHTTSSVAMMASLFLWSFRRMRYYPTLQTISSSTSTSATSVVATPSHRYNKKAAKSRPPTSTNETQQPQQLAEQQGQRAREPTLVLKYRSLFGGRSFASDVLQQAVDYLGVTQCCEVSEEEAHDDDDDYAAQSTATRSSSSAVSETAVLRITPLGRVASEMWKLTARRDDLKHTKDTTTAAAAAAASNILRQVSWRSIPTTRVLLAMATLRLNHQDALQVLKNGFGGDAFSDALTLSHVADWYAFHCVRTDNNTNNNNNHGDRMRSVFLRWATQWGFMPHYECSRRVVKSNTANNNNEEEEEEAVTAAATAAASNRVNVILNAPRALRRAITPATLPSTVCRGWYGPSAVSTIPQPNAFVDDDEESAAAASTSSAARMKQSADAVLQYRFPAVQDLCEICILHPRKHITSNAASKSSSNGGWEHAMELPIELSEPIAAVRILLTSLLENNCIFSQAEASSSSAAITTATPSSSSSKARTIYIDLKLAQSVTLNSLLDDAAPSTHQSLMASGLWIDGQMFDIDAAPVSRADELAHHTVQVASLLDLCDHVAFSAKKRVAEDASQAGGPRVEKAFSGLVPPTKEKHVIDEFIQTALKVGRSRAEGNLKGKRGFGFLTETDVHYAYYTYYMNQSEVEKELAKKK